MAAGSIYTPQSIISNYMPDLNPEVVAVMPNIFALKQMINRRRKKISNFPREPQAFREINIPDNLKITTSRQRFLLLDNEMEDDRIIIYCADWQADLLSNYGHWHCDGTFKTTPSIFYQIYTIHVLVNSITIPCIYALLPNKSLRIYELFLNYLTQLIPNINPERIVVDFEQAVIRAFRNKFSSM